MMIVMLSSMSLVSLVSPTKVHYEATHISSGDIVNNIGDRKNVSAPGYMVIEY